MFFVVAQNTTILFTFVSFVAGSKFVRMNSTGAFESIFSKQILSGSEDSEFKRLYVQQILKAEKGNVGEEEILNKYEKEYTKLQTQEDKLDSKSYKPKSS
jgi:hypothetical protein